MSFGTSPSVFVSSTCFDLAQIRQDLKGFFENLGLTPILSEFGAFPIDPDANAISNCLSNIRANADILVLIIGGRYGSTTSQGKSVTNLEYYEAKAKGIPIYVFVQKSLINILPVWADNPNADFASSVDSPKVFEFVTEVRSTNKDWVFPFETANDIVSTLRVQFSYLFKISLDIRTKFLALDGNILDVDLSPAALRLLTEKPPAWEYLFFGEAIQFELLKHHRLRRDLKYGIRFDAHTFIGDPLEVMTEIRQQLDNILLLAESIANILNSVVQDVLRSDGEDADIEGLAYAASRIAQIYMRIIEWIIKIHHIKADPIFNNALRVLSSAPSTIIHDIESYPAKISKMVRGALEAKRSGKNRRINIMLVMQLPKEFLPELEKELAIIANAYEPR